MRRTLTVATVVLVIGSAAFAGGDKSANPMVDASSLNGGSNGFSNGTSSAAIKSSGCTLQGKIKGLSGLADGDVVLCIGAAAVLGTPLGPGTPLGNAALVRGVHSGGQVKFKADLTAVGCGDPGTAAKIVSFNPVFACFKPDATYADPTSPATNWHTSCAGIALDDPGAAAGDPAKASLLGICQALAGAANPLAPPASGMIAQTGQTILAQ
jgi:hypothetical protein